MKLSFFANHDHVYTNPLGWPKIKHFKLNLMNGPSSLLSSPGVYRKYLVDAAAQQFSSYLENWNVKSCFMGLPTALICIRVKSGFEQQ